MSERRGFVSLKRCFISISCDYEFGNECVEHLCDDLREMGYLTWLNGVCDVMVDKLMIEKADIILVLYSHSYLQEHRSQLEYACEMNKAMIFVKMEKDYDGGEWLNRIIREYSHSHLDFTDNENDQKQELFKHLNVIEARLRELEEVEPIF